MQVTDKKLDSTKLTYKVSATEEELTEFKRQAVSRLKQNVKIPGFRPGKTPDDLAEKHLGINAIQEEALNLAINDLYFKSQDELQERTVGEPKISIEKFVPYSQLDFNVEIEVIGEVTLPDLSKLKLDTPDGAVSKQQLESTLNELRIRQATFEDKTTNAEKDDRLTLDFTAKDSKTQEDLPSAGAKGYNLLLGSHQLIDGFEEQLLGLKAGESKKFSLVFPKDYYEESFRARKVDFEVTVTNVSKVNMPAVDETFISQFGPFKTVKEFEAELKKQIEYENKQAIRRAQEDQVLSELSEKTKVKLPDQLIDREFTYLKDAARQNAVTNGQTWQEFLESRNQNEDDYDKELKDVAAKRVAGGIAIGEIAKEQKLDVTSDELESQIELLKTQYNESQMKAELDKPDNRREIAMRILSQKVLDFVISKIEENKKKSAQKA